jgi:hypothetical protein
MLPVQPGTNPASAITTVKTIWIASRATSGVLGLPRNVSPGVRCVGVRRKHRDEQRDQAGARRVRRW